MKLTFYKYQGTGNDFIIVDNRQNDIMLSERQVRHLCDRRFGIGADGLMLLNTKEDYYFEMSYYNADGRESSMCGNGGRCLVKFAYDSGIIKSDFTFLAIDGEHQASIGFDGKVALKMNDVLSIEKSNGNYIVNTGSPHYVQIANNVMHLDVFKMGQEIR